jgi:hypothetical protein
LAKFENEKTSSSRAEQTLLTPIDQK